MVKFLICIWMSEMKSLLIQRASLIAQFGKNPPAMQETPVWFLGWEDPLEKGKATLSSILAWRIPWSPRGRKELDTTEWLSFSLYPKEDLGKTFCLMTSKTGKGTPSQSSPRDTCNAIFPWWRNGKTGYSKSMNSLLMVSCLPLRRAAWPDSILLILWHLPYHWRWCCQEHGSARFREDATSPAESHSGRECMRIVLALVGLCSELLTVFFCTSSSST